MSKTPYPKGLQFTSFGFKDSDRACRARIVASLPAQNEKFRTFGIHFDQANLRVSQPLQHIIQSMRLHINRFCDFETSIRMHATERFYPFCRKIERPQCRACRPARMRTLPRCASAFASMFRRSLLTMFAWGSNDNTRFSGPASRDARMV